MITQSKESSGQSQQKKESSVSDHNAGAKSTFQFKDDRPLVQNYQYIQQLANGSSQVRQLLGYQKKANGEGNATDTLDQENFTSQLISHRDPSTSNTGTVQRIVIPAVDDAERDIDTDKINFRAFIAHLVKTRNSKRLMYIIKYLTAHGGHEDARWLKIAAEESAKALPEKQAQGITNRVEMIKKVLSPMKFKQLVWLLQRNTETRAHQVLTIKNPLNIEALMKKWLEQEDQFKRIPVSGNWGDTSKLIRPLIKLINSVLKQGLLSPMEARKRGIIPVGSVDKGVNNQISVNTFASINRNLQTARGLALESMSVKDRGSISVSTEREDDSILRGLPSRASDVDLSSSEMSEIVTAAGSDISLQSALIRHKKENKLVEIYRNALNGPLKKVLNMRARGTIMAVLDKQTTGIQSTNVHYHTRKPTENSSQEVRMDSPQVKTGHIIKLLLPDFVRPFFDMIINPADIPLQFVSTREVDAYYKKPGFGDVKVQRVVAPDYVQGIAESLAKEGIISTHIMTANPERERSYAVPADFDEEAVEKELDELYDDEFFEL